MIAQNLILLLATLSAINAAPSPASTSTPSLRKRVIVHDLPQKNSLKRRGEDGQDYADLTQVFKDFDRISSKYSQHNDIYRKHNEVGTKRKRDNALLAAAGSRDEPFDLAQHRRHKRQNEASVSLTADVEAGVDISYYSTQLELGTPGQNFNINFDTGSADLWVQSEQAVQGVSSQPANPLSADVDPADRNVYTPSSSSTNTLSQQQFSITYGTGEIDGVITQDIASINGLTVPDQVFGLATTVSSDFYYTPFDGLMGLGFSTISQTNSNTWTENLVIENKLASKLFSIQLGRASATLTTASATAQVLNNQSGQIIFGAIDSSAYTGDITYMPVTIQAYWQVACDGVAANGDIIQNTAFGAAIDSGTSLVYLPTSVLSAVASAIGATPYNQGGSSAQSSGSAARASGYYTVDCDELNNVDLSLSFGGTLFQFNGADLNGGRISYQSNQCLLAIVGADTTDPSRQPLAIVGDSFMKSIVAVFDYSNGVRVGMASQIGSNATSSPISGNNDSTNTSNASRSAIVSASLLLSAALSMFVC